MFPWSCCVGALSKAAAQAFCQNNHSHSILSHSAFSLCIQHIQMCMFFFSSNSQNYIVSVISQTPHLPSLLLSFSLCLPPFLFSSVSQGWVHSLVHFWSFLFLSPCVLAVPTAIPASASSVLSLLKTLHCACVYFPSSNVCGVETQKHKLKDISGWASVECHVRK